MSLRDRQRLEVASAIHEAAANLLLKQSWTETTVELIAQEAGISVRTFFNYYPTKDDAALGLMPVRIPEEALEKFQQSAADLLERTVTLSAAVLNTANPDTGNRQRQQKLLKKFPHLKGRFNDISLAAGELVEPLILEEITKTHTTQAGQEELQHAADAAQSLRMIAGVILRFAFTKDSKIFSTQSSEIIHDTITLFREAIEL